MPSKLRKNTTPRREAPRQFLTISQKVKLGGGPASMFHIVGLFVDPFNKALLEHSKKALAARKERMERIVKNLTDLGFKITAEDCLRASGGESVGRPHIVAALMEYSENVARMEEIKNDMARAAENDPALKERYDDMIARSEKRGMSADPYTLFLTDSSFINDVYVDYLYSIDMDTAVKLIRDAGGVAVVAHWATIQNKINSGMLESFLKDGRIDGVEVASGFDVSATTETARHIKDIAKRQETIETIGIDAHRPEDFARFIGDQELAEQTVGLTERIVERVRPSLEWTNFGA